MLVKRAFYAPPGPLADICKVKSNELNVQVSARAVSVDDEFQKHRAHTKSIRGVRATSEAPERVMKDERSDPLGETTQTTSC